jgi:hypothetical protein
LSKEGETLEIANFTINDPELDAIASKIRPLPANIVPSEQFVASMRLRILQLPQQQLVAERRAA